MQLTWMRFWNFLTVCKHSFCRNCLISIIPVSFMRIRRECQIESLNMFYWLSSTSTWQSALHRPLSFVISLPNEEFFGCSVPVGGYVMHWCMDSLCFSSNIQSYLYQATSKMGQIYVQNLDLTTCLTLPFSRLRTPQILVCECGHVLTN